MNKKGFTLIEVLASLIVIIIVLVISVPIVTSVINGTTKSAFSSDARMILNSLRIQKDANPDFDLTTVNQSNLLSYQIDDDNYESLTISIEENEPYIYIIGQGKWNGLKACGTYKEMNIYNIEEEGVCLGEEVTSGDPIVVFQNDPNPGIICGDGLVEDYANNDICYIYSVADLVAFSNSVNNGNNYLGKTVELVNNIDIEDNSTYGDVNLTGFGDINGNGSTETLDIELTTGEGFIPIGNNTINFQGTFQGNTRTISNLYINRPARQYTGLFGYNNGYVYGLNLVGANVSGAAYTGGITGYNNGDISDIYLQGSITGYGQNVGGLIGYNATTKSAISLLADVNVEAFTYTYVGGLIGRNFGIASGIVKSGIINSTGSSQYVGKGYGFLSGGVVNVYYSTGVSGVSGEQGVRYDSSLNDNLNGYDAALDTWIGGDNDSNGYYFDYNYSGQIVIKSIKEYPMVFNLTGAGTIESPYLINNYADWKIATLRPNSSYVYSLEADIDFGGKNYYYAMGSNQNYFSGTFNGNGHTLSNITTTNFLNGGTFGYNNGNIYGLKLTGLNLKGNTYTGGITGYNNGNIYGLNVEGLTLSGAAYTGGITGYNNGTVSDIYLQGSITGYGQNVGGLIGYNATNKSAISLLADVNVEAFTYTYVGGLIGRNFGIASGIVKSGIINSTGSKTYVGKGYGYTNGGVVNIYYSNGVSGVSGEQGVRYDSSLNDNLNGYDVALDTWIGGDNNSNGYYFDYNSLGEIVIKSVKDYPMDFNLSGTGTEANPYLINNYADWKTATLRPHTGEVFSLETDIDFSGSNYYYAMGSNQNYFSGTFNGNGHTLSNINTKNLSNSGTFGYNNGNIYGLNVEGLTLSGSTYTGGITGYNNGTVSDIYLQGSITGYGQYIGGLVGYNATTKSAISLLADVNVEAFAYSYVGGLIGQNFGIVKGIVEAGKLSSTGLKTYVGKGYGYTNGGVVNIYCSIGIIGSTNYNRCNTMFDVSNYNNLTSYATYGLETVNTGDIDGNGYYFDYNSDSSDIIVVKVP